MIQFFDFCQIRKYYTLAVRKTQSKISLLTPSHRSSMLYIVRKNDAKYPPHMAMNEYLDKTQTCIDHPKYPLYLPGMKRFGVFAIRRKTMRAFEDVARAEE